MGMDDGRRWTRPCHGLARCTVLVLHQLILHTEGAERGHHGPFPFRSFAPLGIMAGRMSIVTNPPRGDLLPNQIHEMPDGPGARQIEQMNQRDNVQMGRWADGQIHV